MNGPDAAVAHVERLLDGLAEHRQLSTRGRWRRLPAPAGRDRRPAVDAALWLCACFDDAAPTWLLVCDRTHPLWSRVPGGASIDDLVDTDLVAGSHTSSAEVARWLAGEVSLPGDYSGDPEVARRVVRRSGEGGR